MVLDKKESNSHRGNQAQKQKEAQNITFQNKCALRDKFKEKWVALNCRKTTVDAPETLHSFIICSKKIWIMV